jgi:hypothetical protein
MPQNPQHAFFQNPGGDRTTFNITAAAVIKPAPGTLMRINVIAPGTAGSLTFNDCTTTGAATAANEIYTVPFGSLSAGEVITLEWPANAGITVSAVPTGGAFAVAYA